MGRSWISASARIPFTPIRVGHSFGGSQRRGTARGTHPGDKSYAGVIVVAFMLLMLAVTHPVATILIAPLVICTAIAVHANANPNTRLAQAWLRANANIKATKRANKAITDKNDVTIVVDDE